MMLAYHSKENIFNFSIILWLLVSSSTVIEASGLNFVNCLKSPSSHDSSFIKDFVGLPYPRSELLSEAKGKRKLFEIEVGEEADSILKEEKDRRRSFLILQSTFEIILHQHEHISHGEIIIKEHLSNVNNSLDKILQNISLLEGEADSENDASESIFGEIEAYEKNHKLSPSSEERKAYLNEIINRIKLCAQQLSALAGSYQRKTDWALGNVKEIPEHIWELSRTHYSIVIQTSDFLVKHHGLKSEAYELLEDSNFVNVLTHHISKKADIPGYSNQLWPSYKDMFFSSPRTKDCHNLLMLLTSDQWEVFIHQYISKKVNWFELLGTPKVLKRFQRRLQRQHYILFLSLPELPVFKKIEARKKLSRYFRSILNFNIYEKHRSREQNQFFFTKFHVLEYIESLKFQTDPEPVTAIETRTSSNIKPESVVRFELLKSALEDLKMIHLGDYSTVDQESQFFQKLNDLKNKIETEIKPRFKFLDKKCGYSFMTNILRKSLDSHLKQVSSLQKGYWIF